MHRYEGGSGDWPALPLEEWAESYDTLHMFTQIVGKIALARATMANHWWHIALHLSARGLTTEPLSYGSRVIQISFDFIDHRLLVQCSDGTERSFPLRSLSVADFYRQLMGDLDALGFDVSIWTTPVEVEDQIPFEQDDRHSSYDPEYVNRFWRILVKTNRVFREFRSRFVGKVSPVHFFWGALDLAITRFSGIKAPSYSGGAPHVGRWVMEEAYSHEVSSLGFWPGGGSIPYPAYYSYAIPQPPGFAEAPVRPGAAFYSSALGEFILPYDAVRKAEDPEGMLLDFAQSTYEAAADLGKWDRPNLERGYRGREAQDAA